MKFILSILLMSMAVSSYAENKNLPSSCKSVPIEGSSLMLTAEKPGLVMIHNVSNNDSWLTHPSSEVGASAGWSSRLQAGNWSALALDKNAFELNCIESKPGHEQQIPCSSIISVCKWSKVIKSDKENGTFWAGENMSLSALISHLEGRGFKIPKS
ncbi:MAG: hypothetical protein H0U73_10675 [Tatlockia sp.]|nr:hypothetical protein [Tatlockia sp.]